MEAFSKVDERVAKPVLGSDGAARWQEFHQQYRTTTSSSGSAPTADGQVVPPRKSGAPLAPLKASDRASGVVSSWEDERRLENATREQQGLEPLEEKCGYTHFKQNNNNEDNKEISAKERSRIVSKIRPDEHEYFLPALTFQGWKWDYVFTTRTNYGTGYYWDGTDSVLELQGQRQRQGREHGVQGKQTNPATTTKQKRYKDATAKEEEHEPEQQPKKKKKSIITSSVVDIPTGGNHPLEQVAVALHQRHQGGLPVGWYSAKDHFTGKTYYYHGETGERSWDIPTTQATTTAATTTATTSHWQSVLDPSSNKTYYYNAQTKQTTWDKPESTS